MEKLPSQENNVEGQIEQLLGELENYRLDQFDESIRDELEDEWWAAEEGAKNCLIAHRPQALERLRQFVDTLSKTPKRGK